MAIKPYEEVSAQDLAQGNGAGRFSEIGTSGLQAWAGYLRQAYHAELRWPEVYPLFDRIRRSDPEISMVRNVFNSLGRSVDIHWQAPDDPTPDDERAVEFGEEVLDDIDSGIARWRDSCLAYVPFHGWGWWEVVPAMRSETWRPPGGDDWRSKYNDGKIGVRRLAWRDQSSFSSWDLDDATGRLMGLNQFDPPNPPVNIPLDRSVHIIFGDTESPEGLSPLEAVWRLERIKYGLELVQGIGFEHSAGYLDVSSDKALLSPADLTHVRKAARSIMSVQEGNYAAWPKGLSGELKDVNFQAAGSLLEAIRYYGLLKLQVYSMAWIAMASTAKTGAFSAVSDISGMFLQIFNAMVEGFVAQADEQIGNWLFKVNSFPGMSERPKLVATAINKDIALGELGSFAKNFASLFPMGKEDLLAIRRRSGFLPDILPEEDEDITKTPEVPEPEEEDMTDEEPTDGEEEEPEGEPTDGEEEEPEDEEEKELALRPFIVSDDEQPLDVTYLAPVDEKAIRSAVNRFKKWAEKNDPQMADWMDAEIQPEEES